MRKLSGQLGAAPRSASEFTTVCHRTISPEGRTKEKARPRRGRYLDRAIAGGVASPGQQQFYQASDELQENRGIENRGSLGPLVWLRRKSPAGETFRRAVRWVKPALKPSH